MNDWNDPELEERIISSEDVLETIEEAMSAASTLSGMFRKRPDSRGASIPAYIRNVLL